MIKYMKDVLFGIGELNTPFKDNSYCKKIGPYLNVAFEPSYPNRWHGATKDSCSLTFL